MFGSLDFLPLLCTRFRAQIVVKRRKGSLKFLEKVFEKFGSLKNLLYLCTRFRAHKIARS